jgi:hypothetical protein
MRGLGQGVASGAEVVSERRDDPARCLAIPADRRGCRASCPYEQLRDLGDPLRGQTEKLIGSLGNRHGALGVISKRETRYPEISGLLLHPSRVGQDRSGSLEQPEEIQVAEWSDEVQLGMRRRRRQLLDPGAGTWMDGKEHRDLLSQPGQSAERYL